jgi:hypothetical protein
LAADERIHITVERVLTGLRGPLEAALRADGEKAADEARRQTEEQLAQLRATAKKENDDLRASAETQIAELKAMLEDIRRTAEQQIEAARRTVETEVAAVRSRATAEVEEIKHTTDERLGVVTRELEAARAELATARADAAAARTEADSARVDSARIRSTALLADDLRSLDDATSLTDVLERLTQTAGRYAGRAALFIARNDRLRWWHAVGFTARRAGEDVEVPLADAGIAADALRERRASRRAAGEPGRAPAFAEGADSRDAVALPVTVAGTVVAVLYADAPGGAGDTRRWQSDLDAISRYASRVLEAITVQQATGLRAVHAVPRSVQLPDPRAVPGGAA